jgi:desulfoferrodoxin-like iron-binding protein
MGSIPYFGFSRPVVSFEERIDKMTEKGQTFKCEVCRAVVSVLKGGDGDLVCRGQGMKRLSEEEAKALLIR